MQDIDLANQQQQQQVVTVSVQLFSLYFPAFFHYLASHVRFVDSFCPQIPHTSLRTTPAKWKTICLVLRASLEVSNHTVSTGKMSNWLQNFSALPGAVTAHLWPAQSLLGLSNKRLSVGLLKRRISLAGMFFGFFFPQRNQNVALVQMY